MITHGNRKGIAEDEWREVSKKFCRACRFPTDIEFRVWDKKTKKYRRNDMMAKYKTKHLESIKSNSKVTVSELLEEHITTCLSFDLPKKGWQIVLFDNRSSNKIQGNTLLSSIQVPIRKTIEPNKIDDYQRQEIEEIQNIARQEIVESEHLSWEPELTVCQGYVQALIERYGYEALVSAAKSAKSELY
jgi:hypothetical protein